MNTPYVTPHAIERYIERWRPDLSFDLAKIELETLAAHAVPTKRRTISRDAFVWTTVTDDESVIPLAVRHDPHGNNVVITVLDRDAREAPKLATNPDEEILRAHEEDMRALGATGPASYGLPLTEAERIEHNKHMQAETVIERWKNGANISHAALRRACNRLGIDIETLLLYNRHS